MAADRGSVSVAGTTNSAHSYYLAGNGAALILAGLLCGLVIPAATYPRLMLTAHIQFLVNGMISVFAGLMLRTAIATVGQRSATLIVGAHVSVWVVCFSEVFAAITGAKNALPIAAAQAGAPGAVAWQELLVVACHMVPALFLIVAWALLVFGMYTGFVTRHDRSTPDR